MLAKVENITKKNCWVYDRYIEVLSGGCGGGKPTFNWGSNSLKNGM
jgi:hypothetical protein